MTKIYKYISTPLLSLIFLMSSIIVGMLKPQSQQK